jgi:hypothetical protein
MNLTTRVNDNLAVQLNSFVRYFPPLQVVELIMPFTFLT